jgi:hypothetical protein
VTSATSADGKLCLVASLAGDRSPCRRRGRFAVLVAVGEAALQMKDSAIDVLVWLNLNHRRAVIRSNVRFAHCHTSLRLAEAAAVSAIANGSQVNTPVSKKAHD